MRRAGLVWITGASSGIGLELALQYAAAGWRVAATARSTDLLQAAADRNQLIAAFPADIRNAQEVRRTLAAIEARLGPIDLAILNAGTHKSMSAADFSAETAGMLMDLNYMATVHCMEALLSSMRGRRQGHIAVVSSMAGWRGLPTAAAYGPSKAALINLCESLRLEAAALGIRISLIIPGFVRTPLTEKNDFPMPFLMDVEDAARRIRRGLEGGAFALAFPRRLAFLLNLGRLLPYPVYFALVKKVTGT